MSFDSAKTTFAKQVFVLVETVSIAAGCVGKLVADEGGRNRSRNAIIVGNKFDDGDSSTDCQRSLDFGEEGSNGGAIPVVKQIGSEDQAITGVGANESGGGGAIAGAIARVGPVRIQRTVAGVCSRIGLSAIEARAGSRGGVPENSGQPGS